MSPVAQVGISMGARMVLELARRGRAGDIVSLDPGGFWSSGQRLVFGASGIGDVLGLSREGDLL